MSLLLDTHAVVWWLDNDKWLPEKARRMIADPQATVHVSAVTGWEIATKTRKGRWPEAEALIANFEQRLADWRLMVLPVAMKHAVLAGQLPVDHKDPFDRLLAAQSMIEGLVLVTTDPAFAGFDVEVVWG